MVAGVAVGDADLFGTASIAGVVLAGQMEKDGVSFSQTNKLPL